MNRERLEQLANSVETQENYYQNSWERCAVVSCCVLWPDHFRLPPDSPTLEVLNEETGEFEMVSSECSASFEHITKFFDLEPQDSVDIFGSYDEDGLFADGPTAQEKANQIRELIGV